MAHIVHLDCGRLESPLGAACCHCVAVLADNANGDAGSVTLIDAGIGVLDCQHPRTRLSQELVDSAGFVLDEQRTAVRALKRRGVDPASVTDIVLTHADPDHAGGLADFPNAAVHIAAEEYAAAFAGAPDPRYRLPQFSHQPDWRTHERGDATWHGLPARDLSVCNGAVDVAVVELFGHTAGHCGVAVALADDRWLLHAGDAYYLRVELDEPNHPVNELAIAAAYNNAQRLATLESLRAIRRRLGDTLTLVGYHDVAELDAIVDTRHTTRAM